MRESFSFQSRTGGTTGHPGDQKIRPRVSTVLLAIKSPHPFRNILDFFSSSTTLNVLFHSLSFFLFGWWPSAVGGPQKRAKLRLCGGGGGKEKKGKIKVKEKDKGQWAKKKWKKKRDLEKKDLFFLVAVEFDQLVQELITLSSFLFFFLRTHHLP